MNLRKNYVVALGTAVALLLTACGEDGGGAPSTVDYKDISYHIPNGVNVADSKAGSESKLLTTAGNESVAGFFKTEDTQVNQKSSLSNGKAYGEKLYSKINNSSFSFGTLSLLSSQKITSPHIYTVSHYKVVTHTAMKPLELSEKILYTLSGKREIESLSSSDSEEASKEFRLIYVDGVYKGVEFHVASVVAESKYDANEHICTSITNGARVTAKGAAVSNNSQDFTAKAGNNKADFLFVVDDSGSMSNDQDALSKSASNFTTEMGRSGLTYRSAIITTSYQPAGSYYNWDVNHILRDTGIIENNDELLKEKLVAGTNGSNTETGIYNAEQALLSTDEGDSKDGEVTKLGMPLNDATLSVIIISDEPSQYRYRAGKVFDVSDNLFLDRNIRVYSIIKPNGSDGSFDPRNSSQYDDLAYETGGTIADIGNTNSDGELDYSKIMKQIAKDAGGAASTFVLEHPAISVNVVSINGSSVQNSATNGYTYNQSSNSIVLHGNALPQSDFTIKVNYTY